jgi:hypothetical protein
LFVQKSKTNQPINPIVTMVMMTTTVTAAAARNIVKRIIQRTSVTNTTTTSGRQQLSPCLVVAANGPSSSQQRGFATNPNKKKKNTADGNTEDSSSSLSYFERKVVAKQQRVEAYQDKLERASRIKSRRDDSPKDVLKNDFRSFWDGRRAYEEILDRRARQAGMDWTIQVATIVERLPIVMSDKEEFEREFEDLQAYLLAHRGKEYPKEFTGTDGDGRSEAYTDEELIGT